MSENKKETREELLIENAKLKEKLEEKERQNLLIRADLSELLECYDITRDIFSRAEERKTRVQSWLQISFLIGELKADANYSMLIENLEELKRKNKSLLDENITLKEQREVRRTLRPDKQELITENPEIYKK